MRASVLVGSVVLLVVALVGACTSASLDELGGDARFDATAPPFPTLGDSGACRDLDAGSDTGSAHTWTALYADYFGPTGKASCALSGECHGTANGTGATASQFVCGPSADLCYAGMTSPAARLVSFTGDPTSARLYLKLRKCVGATEPPAMPYAPSSAVFSPADMKRIAEWIGEGAPNN